MDAGPRGAGPRLAHRHARRREVPGSALPPLAGRARCYTLLHQPRLASARPSRRLASGTSFLQRLPGVDRYYRYLLPLMPLAARLAAAGAATWSSASATASPRPRRPPPGVPHVCYCFTPMRYAWHMRDAYFAAAAGRLKAARWSTGCSRGCATGTAARPTASRTSSPSAETVQRAHPRVLRPRQRRHLSAGRYRLLHARPRCRARTTTSSCRRSPRTSGSTSPIEACNRLGRQLVVIGTGQDEAQLQGAGRADASTFLGWQPDEVIRDHLRRCRALLFPGEEDFGIVPVEAQACGYAGDRLRPRRGDRDGPPARRGGGPDRRVLRRSRRRTSLSTRSSVRARRRSGSTRGPPAGRRCVPQGALRGRTVRIRRQGRRGKLAGPAVPRRSSSCS